MKKIGIIIISRNITCACGFQSSARAAGVREARGVAVAALGVRALAPPPAAAGAAAAGQNNKRNHQN